MEMLKILSIFEECSILLETNVSEIEGPILPLMHFYHYLQTTISRRWVAITPFVPR